MIRFIDGANRAVFALAFIMTLCGLSPERAAAADATPVNVGIIGRIAAMAPVYLAIDDGIFEKHGLKVKLAQLRAGAELISVLQSGGTDISLGVPTSAFIAIQQGIDVVADFQNEVAHQQPPDTGALIVKKDGPIHSLADLTGKIIAVGELHNQSSVAAIYVLRKAGVDPKKVKFIELPYSSMPDAIRSGQIAAAVTLDPFTTMAVSAGVARVISSIYVEMLPGQPIGAFWSRRDWAEKHPDLVKDFALAMQEAQGILNSDPEKARAAVAKYTGLKPELVSSMPMIDWDSRVDLSKWKTLVQVLQQQGELKKDIDLDRAFTPQMASSIVER